MTSISKKILLSAILIFSYLGTGIGFSKSKEINFSDFDVNSDGFINEVELTNFLLNRFFQLDLDKDGVITKDEALTKIRQRELKKISRLDFNSDGKISEKEFNWIKSIGKLRKYR